MQIFASQNTNPRPVMYKLPPQPLAMISLSMILLLVLGFVFYELKARSHSIVQTGLDRTLLLRLASDPQQSCIRFLSFGTPDLCHCNWLYLCDLAS